MNTAFWRVMWKEYRAVRGFWIAVVVLALFVQLAFVAVMLPGTDRVTSVYGTALGAAALFVVGCMAAAFAAEREEQTLLFLQIVPGTWRSVVGGKLAFAGTSAVALVGVLSAAAYVLAGGGVSLRDSLVNLLAVFGVAVVECWAWSALFSLISRRPLVAAVGAIGVASVAAHVAIWLANPSRNQVWSAATYRNAWHTRLALAAGVAVVATVVSRQWLAGAPVHDVRRRGAGFFGRLRGVLANLMTWPAHALSLASLGRLLWQSWRQWWWVALLAIVATGPVVGIIAKMLSMATETPITPWWTGLCAIAGALFGTLVFLSDQEARQYRFFAERAERPGLVWLARNLFWGMALVAMASATHLGLAYGLVQEPLVTAWDSLDQYLRERANTQFNADWHLERMMESFDEAWSHVGSVAFSAMILLCGFAIGQFCSMAVKSGVIAGFIAVIAAVLFVGWGAGLVAWDLDGHLLWSLLFIPLSLLLATRLRAHGWMLERQSVRSWMLPANVILLPAAVIVLTVPAARLDLATGGRDRFNASQFEQALAEFQAEREILALQGREAADLYLRGCDLVVTWQSFLNDIGQGSNSNEQYEKWRQTDAYESARDEWLARNDDALALALQASDHERCFVPPENLTDRRATEAQELQNAILERGHQLLRRGDLPGALGAYLAALRMAEHFRQGQQSGWIDRLSTERVYESLARWARADGQTGPRLREAMVAIEKNPSKAAGVEKAILASHLQLRSILEGEQDMDAAGVPIDAWRMQLAYLAHQLPWERQRALGVLYALSGERHQTARSFAAALTGGLPLDPYIRWWDRSRFDRHGERRPSDPPPYSWLETTYLLRPLYDELADIHYLLYHLALDEQRRQALLLEMALIAYHLDHGAYPEELDKLAGDYVQSLPLDVFGVQAIGGTVVRGMPFRYHPQGLDGWLRSPQHGLVPPGTPFFWSGGVSGVSLLIDEGTDRVPLEIDRRGNPVRSQDLGGRPLYLLPEYYSYTGYYEGHETLSFYLLPTTRVANDKPRTGRDPREDGVEVTPLRWGGYGEGGYGAGNASGYGGGVRVRWPQDYGTAANSLDASSPLDGLPPGYDLPPLE